MELLAESAEDTLISAENRVRLVFISIPFEKLQHLFFLSCLAMPYSRLMLFDLNILN